MQVFSTINIFIGAFLILPAGKLSDSVPFKYSLPLTSLVKIVAIIWMTTLTSPETIETSVVITLIQVANFFQNILGDVLFAKNLPKETRGLMLSVYQLIGSIGQLIFASAGGYLFDNFGTLSPFFLELSFELVQLVLIVSLILSGRFKS